MCEFCEKDFIKRVDGYEKGKKLYEKNKKHFLFKRL